MLHLEYLHNQWLFLSVVGGFGLVCLMALAYLAVWQRRDEGAQERQAHGKLRHYMPWILAVIFGATIVWGAIYIIQMIYNPPNW
jgi:heme A synthase